MLQRSNLTPPSLGVWDPQTTEEHGVWLRAPLIPAASTVPSQLLLVSEADGDPWICGR